MRWLNSNVTGLSPDTWLFMDQPLGMPLLPLVWALLPSLWAILGASPLGGVPKKKKKVLCKILKVNISTQIRVFEVILF